MTDLSLRTISPQRVQISLIRNTHGANTLIPILPFSILYFNQENIIYVRKPIKYDMKSAIPSLNFNPSVKILNYTITRQPLVIIIFTNHHTDFSKHEYQNIKVNKSLVLAPSVTSQLDRLTTTLYDTHLHLQSVLFRSVETTPNIILTEYFHFNA